MIRVGFLAPSNDAAWLGGISYFRNLLGALADFPDPRIEPVLLTGPKDEAAPLGLAGTRAVSLASLRRGHPRWILRKVGQRMRLADGVLRRELAAVGVQVLSHSGQLGRQAQIATLPWIPDFQHRYFPELFSAAEQAHRDREFRLMCRHATRILLSSAAAKRDLEEFSPAAEGKGRVLQFVANVPDGQSLASSGEIRRKYELPERFLLLPNQFWKHKNHGVVLRALAILRDRGTPLAVAATGNTRDYRQPAYFPSLAAYSREHGLGECFRALGIVPMADLMALMRHSVAVLNPSRFEGWSTSVEEGKSMGKQVLLSSIPVHVEQAPHRAGYFDPDDAEGLAGLMSQAVREWDPAVEARAGETAAAELSPRRQAFAATYWAWVTECIG